MPHGKKPTEILKDEHKDVLQKLGDLEEVINRLHERGAVAAQLKDMASFFDTDFWVHFDKEEKALFPEFDNFMPRGSGPLAVMMEEHEVLRKTNAVMQAAVTRYLNHADDAETRRTITENGMHFIGFLREHIYKEDNILFIMADMHLNADQEERVLKLFESIGVSGAK